MYLSSSLIKSFTVIIAVLIFTITYADAAKKKKDEPKDCTYCNTYETMADWPESERPAAFIYEEIEYASGLHRRLGCPVIDVTNLAIEETAHRVIRLVESRQSKILNRGSTGEES